MTNAVDKSVAEIRSAFDDAAINVVPAAVLSTVVESVDGTVIVNVGITFTGHCATLITGSKLQLCPLLSAKHVPARLLPHQKQSALAAMQSLNTRAKKITLGDNRVLKLKQKNSQHKRTRRSSSRS